MIRGIIDSVVEGSIKRVTMKGMAGETITDRECFQHYGFTSIPLQGAEGIEIREGNLFILVASDDRRYRIALEAGEVAIYDDQGQKIHLKSGGEVHVKALTKVSIDAPAVECTGSVADDTSTMQAMRNIFNSHTHPGDSGGTTGTPNQGM